MVNEARLVEEFMRLVQISSPSRQERAIADYLKRRLGQLDLSVSEDNAAKALGGTSGNLIAKLPGIGPNILLCAHMDTVQPGEGIIPVLKDGIITSQGETVLGGDDKAGIAAILEALEILRQRPAPNLTVVFTVGEEIGLQGAKALEVEALKAEMGFCLDAGGPVGTIINRAPAQNQFKAIIHGRAAHAGICPEEGISAIQVAAEAIMRTKLGRIDPETTANIGVISGGKATNIVPDRVVLEGEARSLSRSKLLKQTGHMTDMLEKICHAKGAKVEISCSEAYPEIDLPDDSPVIKLAGKAFDSLGIAWRVSQTGGGSDANIFNGRGLPTANLGIGMEKVHTCDEFIRVQDMVKVTSFLLKVIEMARE